MQINFRSPARAKQFFAFSQERRPIKIWKERQTNRMIELYARGCDWRNNFRAAKEREYKTRKSSLMRLWMSMYSIRPIMSVFTLFVRHHLSARRQQFLPLMCIPRDVLWDFFGAAASWARPQISQHSDWKLIGVLRYWKINALYLTYHHAGTVPLLDQTDSSTRAMLAVFSDSAPSPENSNKIN